MAARLLRHVSIAPGTTVTTIVSAIPASRALVGKFTAANATGGTATVTVYQAGNQLVSSLSLGVGETYSEKIVMVAGETLTAVCGAANSVVIHVHGEEVDN